MTEVLPNVAFMGKAGAGKTTAAEMLCKYKGYEPLSFARPLKEVAKMIWGPEAERDREKLQRLGVAVRDIDENAWANILVRAVENAPERAYTGGDKDIELRLDPSSPEPDAVVPSHLAPPRFVVDDLRFPNEYWALRGAGFLIVRVAAPRLDRITRLRQNGKLQDEAQLEHISETALDDTTQYPYDYVLYNEQGYVEETWQGLCAILDREVR